MSQRAYEAIIPLHEYDLRPSARIDNEPIRPEDVALYCRRCGLLLANWTKPPGLDLVVRVARDHELSAHHRAPNPAGNHRPGGGP